ncbi:MAG: trypsin-like peptidase domain-containing protein [Oscillospiraceae bacterium]|nr:trypsin-like peptidase domain-containing protein [Oscillospiraceae bacterium]
MRNRLISIILAACLALVLCAPALGAMSLANFDRVREYQDGFSDVPVSAWFYSGVRSVYERGIMAGREPGLFDPHGRITIAETIKIAASIHRIFHTGSMEFPSGSPWYAPYLDYARRNDIRIGAFRNFTAPITRADFAVIMASALPDEALTPINRIADGAIPDVLERFSYGQAVYKLYRAGVLTGADGDGAFFPGRTLTRAEAAAIIARMVEADLRMVMTRDIPLPAEQIYAMASPAVFLIQVLDDDDEVLKTGSGFFICETGLAVTNYHVVVGAHSVRIVLDDGEVLDAAGLYDFCRATDAALIQVDGGDFAYLNISDAPLRTGATVFALGSPLGLQASFSRGIVSQALREVEGMTFIQLDAAISTGSSGGALLDVYGRVVGVTTATMQGSQNINLAVPIEAFIALSSESYVPFADMLASIVHFEGFYPAPDFGAHFGVRPWDTRDQLGGTSFSFRLRDLPGDIDDIIDEYMHLVYQSLFEHVGFVTFGGQRGALMRRYFNSRHGVMLTLGVEVVRSVEVFTVNVNAGSPFEPW